MADVPILKPEDIASLTTFFGNGFVYRYAFRKVRGQRTEGDIHTIIHSVVASLILWVPYTLGTAVAGDRFFVSKAYQLPCSTALFLSLSYVIGLAWGYVPQFATLLNWERLKKRLGTVESQSIMRFLQHGQGKWMRFRMEDGRIYEGMIAHYDGDPERFKDVHIALQWPSYSNGEEDFEPLEGVEEVLICVSDVKAIQILPPPEVEAQAKRSKGAGGTEAPAPSPEKESS